MTSDEHSGGTGPPMVAMATERATAVGFTMGCDPGAGALLAVLAAAVPPGGRILEMGTGAGVGLAWIVSGVAGRSDVDVVSVECDRAVAAVAADLEWPPTVRLVMGDGRDLVTRPAQWDLVFADAQGGKWEGLDDTVRSLRPGGLLLVDDMAPDEFLDDHHRSKTAEVRHALMSADELVAVEMGWSSGLILCARRPAA